MRTFHQYISDVKASRQAGSGAGTGPGTGAGAGHRTNQIQLDPDGFPIAPSPSSWDKFTKLDLEQLYRSYITHQYRMLMSLSTACR